MTEIESLLRKSTGMEAYNWADSDSDIKGVGLIFGGFEFILPASTRFWRRVSDGHTSQSLAFEVSKLLSSTAMDVISTVSAYAIGAEVSQGDNLIEIALSVVTAKIIANTITHFGIDHLEKEHRGSNRLLNS